MGKLNDLSPRKRALIKFHLEETTFSQKEIAKKLEISPALVCRVKKSLAAGGDLGVSRAGRCGRKKKLSPRDERKLVKMAKDNRRATSRDLKAKLEAYGVSVSDSYVRRKLTESGMPARRPRKKAKITPTMAKKRLEWAKHVSETFKDL